jgi:hypothetical protein
MNEDKNVLIILQSHYLGICPLSSSLDTSASHIDFVNDLSGTTFAARMMMKKPHKGIEI